MYEVIKIGEEKIEELYKIEETILMILRPRTFCQVG